MLDKEKRYFHDSELNYYQHKQFMINFIQKILDLNQTLTKHCIDDITHTSHHSKMQKDGWAKFIPNFAFD